jgi:hypothetical protein
VINVTTVVMAETEFHQMPADGQNCLLGTLYLVWSALAWAESPAHKHSIWPT